VQLRGWREAMLIVAVGALLLSILIWVFTRDHPSQNPVEKTTKPDNSGGALAALWRVAKTRQTFPVSMFACLVGAPALAFGALWGVPYTMQAFDVSRTQAAFSMSFTLFGWMIGGPFWGWISDKMQRRKQPIIIGALITTSSMTAALYAPGLNLEVYRVLLFINGFAAGTMAISYALIKEHNAGNGSGAAMGLVNMMAVAGGAVFQPIVGMLLDAQWQGTLIDGARIYSLEAYANAFALLPVLYFGSLVFGLCIRETYAQPVTAQLPV
jgi:MFS family permease